MTQLTDLPIRDDLRGLSPYGAPQVTVPIRLNVNENTHRVPENIAQDIVGALAEAVMTANRYPDREFTVLREALSLYLGHDLTPAHLWAANGSNEVIQQIFQAFGGPGRSVLGFPPTYSMHSIIANSTGTMWVPVQRDEVFALTAETVTRAIGENSPDIVVLCSPNNPTGTALGLEVIEAAYEAARGIVLVDEAYAEFSTRTTALTLLEGRPRLLVSRTMSKAFAFAGVRLGYLAADPAVGDALRLVRLPYHLSSLTQAAAIAALGHSSEMLAMVDDIIQQRDRIVEGLRELDFVPSPSDANFVLFGGVSDTEGTFSALLERGIIIRDVGIPHHLRVTAGTRSETDAFLAALTEIVGRSAQHADDAITRIVP